MDAESYVKASLSLQLASFEITGDAAKIFDADNIASGSISAGNSQRFLRRVVDKEPEYHSGHEVMQGSHPP